MKNRLFLKHALALAGALLFLVSGSARAQTQTNVTATITDPLGIPYANGTYSIQLIPTGTNPTVNGQAIGGAFNGSTDANGRINVALWPNASISPAGTQWQFTICISPGVQPPLGTGGQCSTPPAVVTISGTSQDLSSTLSAVAPRLTSITNGSISSVAGSSPIVVTTVAGVATVSCPTCTTSSSTVPINRVVSATGPIVTIADGNNPLVINCALTSGTTCLTLGETTAAITAGAVETQIATLTTSTAIPLQITQGAAGPTGANAPAVLNISSAASGGAASGTSGGFSGASITLRTGAGSPTIPASASGAGNGGGFSINLGSGGSAGTSTGAGIPGGNGGLLLSLGGSGGIGDPTGPGGNGSNVIFINGNGGNGGTTSGAGGAGGQFAVTSGNGGNAHAGSSVGQGGNITFTLGSVGTGGVLNTNPGVFSIIGATVPGSQVTSLLNLTETWNTTGVVDAAIFLNITNTASGAGSRLMDLQIGAVSQFSVNKSGLAALGVDNSVAGTYQASNGSAAAHTLWGSQATTSNEVDGPTVAIVSGDLVSMTTVGTVQRLTDGGLLAVNTPNISACGTSTVCTSSLLNLPHIFFGTATLNGATPSTVTVSGLSPSFGGAGTYACTLAAQSNATTALFSVANVTGSVFTITGPAASTTAVNYICVGN